MRTNSVIISAKRTPVGSFQGALSSFSAPQLGSEVFKGILADINFDDDLINEVIMGNVLGAGIGQAPARQAALLSGLPNNVSCLTINKMCGSGLKAIMLADQVIQCSDSEVVLAGGMESMSNAPYLINNFRKGQKLGHGKIIDSMIHDGLWDVYNNMHMGNCAEMLSSKRNYSREAQDQFAKKSYQKALLAQSEKVFHQEIIPIKIEKKRSEVTFIKEDEEPGKVKFDKISKLRPAFEKEGTITAANASKLNDGAAAALVMSEKKAYELHLEPIARIVAHCSYAHEPEWFTTAPGEAIRLVLKKAGMDFNEIDLWEINEAFSSVTMAAIEDFKINPDIVNVYGGAVAIGHPIGASGARIIATLLNGMIKKNKKYGLAVLCIGGGEASAMILEKL
jgi:acetyl-CoA C-acetyltransferase